MILDFLKEKDFDLKSLHVCVGRGGLPSGPLVKLCFSGRYSEEVIIDAFIYQISKNICSMAAALKGHVDRIILTGGIAYEDYITDGIKERVSFVAPVTVYKGGDELLSLAEGAIRVMRNEEEAKVYA